MHWTKCSLMSFGALLLCCRPFLGAGYEGASSSTGKGMMRPVIGLVMAGSDGSRAVRELVGIPGSAVMLDPEPLPAGTVHAVIAPRQSYGLAISVDGSLAVFSVLDGAVELKQVPGAQPDVKAVFVFAPSGVTAACYSADSGLVQVIEGLPATPKVSHSYKTAMPAELRLLSVSDDASVVLAGAADNAVYVLAEDSAPKLIYSAAALQGLTFLPNRADAVVLDSGTASLSLIRNINVDAAFAGNIATGLSMGSNSKLAASDDSNVVVLSDPSSKTVTLIDLRTLQINSTHTDVRITDLVPLQHANEFLISAPADQPAWVFEYSKSASRVFFVPPASSDGGTK
jgi:hypothetical protein